PVEVSLCGDKTIDLRAGGHDVSMVGGNTWIAERLVLDSTAANAESVSTRVAMSATASSWGSQRRLVRVSDRRESSYLTVSENANAGWKATWHDKELDPVTIDGWQQGYVLPAGSAGAVVLTFAPAASYQSAVIGGLGLLGCLAIGAAIACVRRRPGPGAVQAGWRLPTVPWVTALVLCAGLIGGTWGAVEAAAMVGAAMVIRKRRDIPLDFLWPGIIGAGVVIAGVLLALKPWGHAGYSGDGAVSQLLVLGAIVAAALPTVLIPVSGEVASTARPEPDTEATTPEH
ncbi:MAG: hypothetical protein ABIR57_14425, partial [Aeromicrobium sp.]